MATPTLRFVEPTTPEEDLVFAPEPVIMYGLSSGAGTSEDIAVGREILQVSGSVDLGTVPDFEKYSYIDVRELDPDGRATITLPDPEAYGQGRILYVIDKLGLVDPEEWRPRIFLKAPGATGIDGLTDYVISERHGYVGVRASNVGTVPKEEWQIVSANPSRNHTSGGFANWVITPNAIGVGELMRWSGSHVYVPLKFELYGPHSANKFWIRYYPTEAMAISDKDRTFGTDAADGITVLSEFIVGGDASATSYGTGQVVSSWKADGTPENVRYVVVQQVDGTPGRISGTATYKDMVFVQG